MIPGSEGSDPAPTGDGGNIAFSSCGMPSDGIGAADGKHHATEGLSKATDGAPVGKFGSAAGQSLHVVREKRSAAEVAGEEHRQVSLNLGEYLPGTTATLDEAHWRGYKRAKCCESGGDLAPAKLSAMNEAGIARSGDGAWKSGSLVEAGPLSGAEIVRPYAKTTAKTEVGTLPPAATRFTTTESVDVGRSSELMEQARTRLNRF